VTAIDALEHARARLAELREPKGSDASLLDQQRIATRRYEINEINEESTDEHSARQWLTRAREAVVLQIAEPATAESLVAVRHKKYQVLVDAPTEAPADRELLIAMRSSAAVLAQQTEALGWLVRVFRGQLVDPDRLAKLTLQEAWRLERHDVFERVWRSIDGEPFHGDLEGNAVQGS
jgi:hypothetical protein